MPLVIEMDTTLRLFNLVKNVFNVKNIKQEVE